MKYTNHSNLPEVFVRAVQNDPYNAEGSDITCTTLINPPRIRMLSKRNWDLLEEDVADVTWRLQGQSMHYVLERAKRRTDIAEKRLFFKDDDITNGWNLSGQFDLLEQDGTLIDFKNTSAWKAVKGKSNIDWERQLNVLDFLCRKNPSVLVKYNKQYKVKELQVVAILRDWSKLQVAKYDHYPKKPAVTLPIRKWEYSEQEDYIRARIKTHQESETATTLPLCSPEERWRQDDKYAVMVENRKTAKRLLDTEDQAKSYIVKNKLTGKSKIVKRVGGDRRCQSYCIVNGFCDYYMEVKNGK